MSNITPFTFPTTGQTVRTVVIDGEPWVVAADVTAILGYANGNRDVNRHVPERHRGAYRIGTPSGDQQMTVISEAGVWRLVMRSNQAQAESFQNWLAEEVIPSIRKTGSYSIGQVSRKELARMVIEAEEALEEANDRALAAEHQMLALAPAAYSWDVLNDTGADMDFTQAAQVLNRDPNISMGRNRLFVYTDSIGWTYKHGSEPRRPYQAQVNLGRLTLRMPKTFTNKKTRQEELADSQIGITPKGLAELHRLLGGVSDFRALMSEEVSV